MPTKKELEKNADEVIASSASAATPVEQFCIIWTGIVKPALELIKSFTGPKVDEQLEALEKAADNICNSTNPDVANYCKVWNTFHLKSIFKGIQLITGPKVDKALNRFIEISDSLCA